MVQPNATADADQKRIIDLQGGRHLVLAPPGCGKTFILAERVIKAHAHGVDYKDMICLTFTNRASRGMRDRISQRTGNPVPPDLFVGNLHRFCSNYLFEQKKIPQNSAVIDDIDAESIITALCHLDPTENNTHYANDIVNLQHAISQKEGGMPERLIVHADQLEDADSGHWKTKAAFARMYAKYKETDSLLDFEDLLEKAYFFAHQDAERHRYSWIEVDEVQDLSFLQLAIIDLFATEDATIVFLGDDQQAIFSFVGAKLEALQQLKAKCSPNIHRLGKNHRSPKYLLDIFNTYATHQLKIDPALLPATDNNAEAKPQDCCIFRACHHSVPPGTRTERCATDGTDCRSCTRAFANEYRLAVCLAQRYAAFSDSDRVAIIVPTNVDADRLSKEFGKTPHFKISGRDLFSTPAVQLLFAHLNVVANETCFIAWARLLYHLKVVPEYALARNMMRELRNRAISPTDLLMYTESTYLQQFASVLDNQEVVLFDTETTGLDIWNDDIIQIAAIKIDHGRYVEGSDFNIIIQTDKEIPTTVGGHDNPMLTEYLNSERLGRREGLQAFLDYCEGRVLIGHNVEYDYNILDYNLRRTFGQGLGHRQRFDTLKLTRLVEPRLRVYKLERLLETLHLEGTNSHNAIDDVKATLSLLTYCRAKASQLIPLQQQLLSQPNMRLLAMRFKEIYLPLFLHTYQRQYSVPQAVGTPDANEVPIMVQELEYAYSTLRQQGIIEEVPKWQHIVDYLSVDMVDTSLAPTLRQQLDLYLADLNTVRESDLCDSSSMQRYGRERFFIATAHKAKGLEFDSVIVFNATEGAYPYALNIRKQDKEHIAEDARRFYVAISRAKKRLCFTYAQNNSRGGCDAPSPFLRPIVSQLTHFCFDPESGKLKASPLLPGNDSE